MERDLSNVPLPGLLSEPAAPPPPAVEETASEVSPAVPASPDYERRLADLERQLETANARAQDNRDAYQREFDLRQQLGTAIEDVRQRELQRQAFERQMAPIPVPDFSEADVLDHPEKVRELAGAVKALDERYRQVFGYTAQVANQLAAQTQSATRRDQMSAVEVIRQRVKDRGWDDFDQLWPKIESDLRAADRAQPGASAQLFANPEAIYTSYLYHRDANGGFTSNAASTRERAPVSAPVGPQVPVTNGRVPIRNPQVRKMYEEFGIDPDKGVDAARVSGIYGTPSAFLPGGKPSGRA